MYLPDDKLVAEIFKTSEDFYHKIKEIYAHTGYDKEYPLNFFWGGDNMRQLTGIINAASTPQEKIAAIHDTFMFSVNTSDEEVKGLMIDWYLDHLHSRGTPIDQFDFAIQESPVSNPRNAVRHGDRLLAPDFLRTVILATEIKRHCALAGPKFNILELGAGYGGLARTLKLFFPNTSYVITDIPETLFFSSIFLRLNFPQAKVCFVTGEESLREPISNYDFVFVPTKFAGLLSGNSFELFCNTASLGEMRSEVIRHWLDFVQNKVSVRYFFSLNRFLNTIVPTQHAWRLEENVCSVSFDRRWRMLKWELEPAFARCPYLETIVTRNLEVIAERLPVSASNDAYARHLSDQISTHLAKQDWVRHAGEDNSMLLRDNILAHDLGQQGTLFKLWEAIRLHPSPENVSLMLLHLRSLMRDKPFEEMYYYQQLLKQLLAEDPAATNPALVIKARTLVTDTLDALRRPKAPRAPTLVQQGYHGFNLIEWQGLCLALAQSLGPVNLCETSTETLKQYASRGLCLADGTPDGARTAVDRLLATASHPKTAPSPKDTLVGAA